MVYTTKSFRDLIVWHKSFALVKEVYYLTGEFPPLEKFGLTRQMQRAAISIPSNIAEGSSRGSRKAYVQFLRIALGSASELETQLLLARELYTSNITNAEQFIIEIKKMLHAMIKKLTLTPNT